MDTDNKWCYKPMSFNYLISHIIWWVRENIQYLQHLNLMKMARIKIQEVTAPGHHAAGEHHGQTDRCPLCFWKTSRPDKQTATILPENIMARETAYIFFNSINIRKFLRNCKSKQRKCSFHS